MGILIICLNTYFVLKFMQNYRILVDTTTQTLTIFCYNTIVDTFCISTAKNGTGQLENSYCTPLGVHVIAEKIGTNCPINTVFVGRKFTGEVYDENLGKQYPDRDWILSRILWLKGTEMGKNLGKTADGKSCDTYGRYVYIHGTPDSEPMGVPMSHGCIRMRNEDIIKLYECVAVGTCVEIV